MKKAILLVGPTGSGKTPLGQELQAHGLRGRRCMHFDFGENLRLAGEGKGSLGENEVDFVRGVLQSGALLEDEHFHIADKILRAFMADRNVGDEDLVILNGLPRHAGQARDVDSILRVETLVSLLCTAETVFERIATNAGGDRTQRTDDDVAAIRNKLAIYKARTEPLIDHYRLGGAKIETLDIKTSTTPTDAWKTLTEKAVSY